MQKIAKKLDIFSTGFNFTVDKQFKKKTNFGGILSCAILILLIIYFFYLLYLYFSNQFIPKIITNLLTQLYRTDYSPNEDFVYFEMIIGNKSLSQYEKEAGKKYITYRLVQEYYAQDGSLSTNEIPLQIYNNQQSLFDGYRYIDKKSYNEVISIMVDASQNIQNDLALHVERCLNKPECATVDEIDDLILNPLNYFQMFFKIEQFNTTSQLLEVSFKSEYYFFDIDLVQQTELVIKRAKTEIQSGLFIQQSEYHDHLTGYTRKDRQFTTRKLDYRQGLVGYAEFLFELDQEVQYTTIQMPMITEILSQFFSIVNILMVFGIATKYLAQTDIVHDVAKIILRDYYFNTAFELSIKDNEIQNSTKDTLKRLETFNHLKQRVDEYDILEQFQQKAQLSVIDRIKMVFYKKTNNKQQNKESQLYQHLIFEAMDQINIYQVFKDLIEMKKAMKLIFTEDQYAALQYCGSQIKVQDKLNNEKNSSLIEKNKIDLELNKRIDIEQQQKDVTSNTYNHISKIDEIQNDPELIKTYYLQFLENYKKGTNITEIDRRIYSSLFKSQ